MISTCTKDFSWKKKMTQIRQISKEKNKIQITADFNDKFQKLPRI
jgi:hypothetical protein